MRASLPRVSHLQLRCEEVFGGYSVMNVTSSPAASLDPPSEARPSELEPPVSVSSKPAADLMQAASIPSALVSETAEEATDPVLGLCSFPMT